MKRIIEIEESLYSTIMCTPHSPVLGWHEIAQSVPYNPSEDCISREWVKTNFAKEFFKAIGSGNDTPFEVFGTVKKVIDNAPTVEPRIEYGTDGQPYRLFMSGGRVVPDMLQGWRYEERPKGEWLKSDVPESVLAKCSVCGFDCGAYTHNFCPHCGADMKGGA